MPPQQQILVAPAVFEKKRFGTVPIGPAKAEPRPTSPSAPELPKPKARPLQQLIELAIDMTIWGARFGSIQAGILWAILLAIVFWMVVAIYWTILGGNHRDAHWGDQRHDLRGDRHPDPLGDQGKGRIRLNFLDIVGSQVVGKVTSRGPVW